MSTFRRQINARELRKRYGCTTAELVWMSEYIKDFDQRRAAKATGLHPDQGNEMLASERVQNALDEIVSDRLEESGIDLSWLLTEMVDNHYIARQTGKLSASNTALGLIGRHVKVDAFTAEKVQLDLSQDVVTRLMRGRQRAAEGLPSPAPASPTVEDASDLSFL